MLLLVRSPEAFVTDHPRLFFNVLKAFDTFFSRLCVSLVLSVLAASLCLAEGSLRASSVLHTYLLRNVLSSVMQFFDTTPQGRLISRFSKDVDILDNTIPFCIKSWLLCLVGVCDLSFWPFPLVLDTPRVKCDTKSLIIGLEWDGRVVSNYC